MFLFFAKKEVSNKFPPKKLYHFIPEAQGPPPRGE